MRVVPCCRPFIEIVHQRIVCHPRAAWYSGQIKIGVEAPMGVVTVLGAQRDKIGQRINAQLRDLRITIDIPFHVEQRVGGSTLAPAILEVMCQGVEAALRDITVAAKIKGSVEKRANNVFVSGWAICRSDQHTLTASLMGTRSRPSGYIANSYPRTTKPNRRGRFAVLQPGRT